ncbi:PAS domain S-box protein [[Eubacterium] cellulosolvens]
MKKGNMYKVIEDAQESHEYDSENLNECILKNTNGQAMVIGPNFVVKDVKDSILEQYNWKREDIIGRYCYDIMRSKNKSCLKSKNKCPILEVFGTSKPVQIITTPGKDIQALHNAEVYAFPIFDKDGNIDCRVELCHDLLNLKPGSPQREPDLPIGIKTELFDIFQIPKNSLMFLRILQTIVKVTDSHYGVFGYVDSDGALVLPAMSMDIWDLYKVSNNKIIIPRKAWVGIWGRALKEKKIFYTNKQFLPPKRYIPISNGLCVPIVYQDNVLGLFIIGDRKSNIGIQEKTLLHNIATYAAPYLASRLKNINNNENCNVMVETISNQVVKENYQQIFEVLPNLITAVNTKGLIIDCNNRIFDYLGYTRDEVIGLPLLSIIHPDCHAKAQEALDNFSAGTHAFQAENDEYKLLCKDTNSITVLVSSSSLNHRKGKDLLLIWVIEDITERRRIEQRISEEQYRVDVYFDILGHDINNINQTIRSYSELFLLKPDLSEQYRNYIQTILNQSRAISDLISNIRKLSQLKKGEFKIEPIDVFRVLADASERVQQAYPHRRIKINQAIFESEVLVKSNGMLMDAIVNIISNAVKFDTHDEVNIEIVHSISDDGRFWRLEFKDHGPGVLDRIKKKIFEGFEKGDESIRGSGLGLAVVKEVVSGSGGTVWVEDRVEDDISQGSNFVLLLPKV